MILVSEWRCWVLVFRVQPVIVLKAAFWIFWSLLREVDEMMGDQMVLAYSMMGRSNVLYVVMSVSLLFFQCVDVRSFRRLSVFFALVMVFVWVEYFSLGSKVNPRMVGLEVVGMGMLLMWMFRGLLYSDGSGVMRVDVVLVGLICSLLL